MGSFSNLISQISGMGASLTKALPPPDAGIYHFLIEEGGGKTRAHLRVELDGHGLLLVNANRSFHLNPTATHLAYLYLSKEQQASVVASLTHNYHVSKRQALQDYTQLVEQLKELLRPDGACPVCDLNLETIAPFSVMPSAPYRMDLAVTYRCNNDCSHCYNERGRHTPELTTERWKRVLDQLWDAGIPHIVFTGGEPTLRPDLPELVAHAREEWTNHRDQH